MKVTVIATTPTMPWELGQELKVEISFLEDRMHQLMIDDKKYIFETSEVVFVDNKTTLLTGFITDSVNVGKAGFKIEY